MAEPWKFLHVARKPTGFGVAVIQVVRPSGTVVEIPISLTDLRKIVIEAATAMEPGDV